MRFDLRGNVLTQPIVPRQIVDGHSPLQLSLPIHELTKFIEMKIRIGNHLEARAGIQGAQLESSTEPIHNSTNALV